VERLMQTAESEVTMVKTGVDFGYRDVVEAGIIGGIVFAIFEMVAAAALAAPQAFFVPLQMVGAMVLGPAALDPGYSVVAAGLAGVTVHMVLSFVFALIFASLATPTTSAAALAAGGIAFGIVVWLVNFYLVAPLAGWTWFPDRSNQVVQFRAHAFFYGCPVGWYLGRSRVAMGPPSA
jgi:uncharacterized membrane protein YagU involved in acid resistance